jgi:hypothetical protein
MKSRRSKEEATFDLASNAQVEALIKSIKRYDAQNRATQNRVTPKRNLALVLLKSTHKTRQAIENLTESSDPAVPVVVKAKAKGAGA